MPELPEVETVVRYIAPYLEGKSINRVSHLNNYQKVLATHSPVIFNKLVSGQNIKRVWRRAKYIVMDLEVGHLLVHLRMTGRLLTKLTEDDKPNHLTVHMQLNDGSELYFKDYRKFGRWYYYQNLDYINSRLGIEPLSNEFTADWLYKNLHGRTRQLKALLLDQSFVAGLGNIYVDEVLWAAKLHPQKLSTLVSRKKNDILHSAIRDILQLAIAQQGTTIINFYFGEGSKGNFKTALNVFDRQGQSCPRCSTIIKKIKISQRGTHICPRCQRL
jgi:formamidopyrimidine-DNA glycosylase